MRTELPHVTSALTGPVLRPLGTSSCIWKGVGISTVPCHVFSGAWQKTQLLALQLLDQGYTWKPYWQISRFPQATAVLCLGLLSLHWMPSLFPYKCGVHAVQWRHGGQTPAGAQHHVGFVFSAVVPHGQVLVQNQSSSAPMVSSHVAPLEASCGASEAWPCSPVKRCKASLHAWGPLTVLYYGHYLLLIGLHVFSVVPNSGFHFVQGTLNFSSYFSLASLYHGLCLF